MAMFLKFCLLSIVCSTLIACAMNPSGQAQALQSSLVNMVDAGLLASEGGRPELGLTLTNVSPAPLWVLVHFKTPDSVGDCVLAQEMNASDEHFFACPQQSIQAAADYQINIEVREQATQRNPTEVLSTNMSFSATDIANAGG